MSAHPDPFDLDAMLATLERYTRLESPTGDAAALDALAEVLERDAAAAGFRVERIAEASGDHLRWVLPAVDDAGAPVLLLSHYDTVWPVGRIADLPWSVDGDVVRGPGVFDTKSGIVSLLAAARSLVATGVAHPEVRVLVVADEEDGSLTSAPHVRAEAAAAGAVLGLEPAHPDGALKTARRGSTRVRLTVHGREAHAATDPDRGVSAIDELIDQLGRLREIVSGRPVLCNVGIISGGGRANVVAGRASAEVGLRFLSTDDEHAVLGGIRALRPIRDGAVLEVEQLSHRPTWSEGEHGARLLARVDRVAASLGGPLGGRPAAGAADTNAAGAAGHPTIDGLAPRGGGAHAVTEHVSARSMVERARLIAAVIADFAATPDAS
ncbi:M20/M25/M40 family metallo-hydrolase [Agromyces sp. CFH 90414]|uniref:M20/M25/M40 family metallo-hydrolase n=1 Tax=Agromyces agglutinans TaxID=2662258 RepID=A0A6I2FC98_9MICO|nr:M20/M25/M40 family metallo-hydrolase [Agromyces agglutinans]MRG60320.1 M20/M25/M40 family metallo-hydrolase [Agromyces agglutinans]